MTWKKNILSLCGIVTFLLIILQMQYKLNYITYTRSTLAFTHKTIDDMLSKFDDGNTTAIYNNKNNRKPAIEILGKKFYLKRKRKIRDVVIVPPINTTKQSSSSSIVAEEKESSNDNRNNSNINNETNYEKPSDTCIKLGSTYRKSAPINLKALLIVPVPKSIWKLHVSDVKKAHVDFISQFADLFHEPHHIIFMWRFGLYTDGEEGKIRQRLEKFKQTFTKIIDQIMLTDKEIRENVFVSFFACTETDANNQEDLKVAISEAVEPYLVKDGFIENKKRIVITSIFAEFITHRQGATEKNRKCPYHNFLAKKYHCGDCNWATNRACVNDNSKCFHTCCCKYFDPSGISRLTEAFYTDHFDDSYKDVSKNIYAIGGYKIGKDNKVGLGCFTKKSNKSTSLIRVYKNQVTSGKTDDGKHLMGYSYAICDLVEMPLSINPKKKTTETIGIIVVAAWVGDEYLASPKARGIFEKTHLNDRNFGFNPYFTSKEMTFVGNKYVDWSSTTFKIWKNTSLCYTGKDAKTRANLLYDTTKLLHKIVTSNKGITLGQSTSFANYGSLLTPLKIGAMPYV